MMIELPLKDLLSVEGSNGGKTLQRGIQVREHRAASCNKPNASC